MKVLIIGAYGQLGTDLRKTVPEGIELVCPRRTELDITDRESVKKFFSEVEPDLIINCAAYVKVDLAEDEVREAFSINAYGVKNILDNLKKEIPIVHVSTDYVFDGKKGKVKEPYYEDDIPNPINIYGLSKYAGELILKNYYDKYYIVRSSSLYGVVGASGKGGNFPYTIIKKAKTGEKLRVVDDIYMVPTHTYDLANGIWKLILGEYPYGIYHITHTGYCSWYEFAKKILELAGIETEIEPVKHTEFPTKAKRPLWSVLGTKKGIKLNHWEKGLRRFIEYAKAEGRI